MLTLVAHVSSAGAEAGSLRVVHVTAPAEFGGLEQVVRALVLGQSGTEDPHDVSVVAFVDRAAPEPPLIQDLRNSAVSVHAIGTGRRDYVAQRRALANTLRELRPHVVHSHGYHSDVFVASTRDAHGGALASTVHGFTGGDVKNRIYEWLQCHALRRFDAVVAVSTPIAERLRATGVRGERTHVLRNAWSPSEATSRDEARRVLGIRTRSNPGTLEIGWVGRLSQEKGPDIMVEALHLLADLPVHATFIGTGIQQTALQLFAERLGVADRITWAGALREAGKLLAAFDVLVMSSRTEGTPIVLFEAVSAGTPVITTAVGGIPDVVSPAEAVLVRDVSPAGVATAVRVFAGDRAAATDRSAAAKRRLQRDFAVAPWIDSYTAIYRSMPRRTA